MIRSVNLETNKTTDTNNSVKKTSNNQTFTSVLDNVTKTNTEASKTTTMDDIFNRASNKYNVSVDLLKAVAKAESNFNPKAVSKSGARGVMQLMPKTAEYLGVKDSFDPEQNIMGGAKYLSQMLDKYDGNEKLALAAYNAGSGNVAKYGGIPPFKETQNYVVKVLKYKGTDISVPNTTVKQPSTSANVSQPSVNAAGTTTNSTNNTNSVSDASKLIEVQNADEIYSYEDYLDFIDKWKDQLDLLYMTRNIDAIQNILDKSTGVYNLRAEEKENSNIWTNQNS